MRNSSHTNALLDMWHAMENAQHIIYITNWHFNPETKNPFDESLPTIGELLKKKSEQDEYLSVLAATLYTSCLRLGMYEHCHMLCEHVMRKRAHM